MKWYFDALQKYAVFSGRARRKEYWMFFLFNMIFSLILGFMDGAAGLISKGHLWGPLGGLYALAVLIPGISAAVRRLHDTDRSGWWLLVCLVPLVGIVILFFMCQDSTSGDNQYGPNPKIISA